MRQKLLVAMDVGGTKISAALVTPSGKIVSRSKTPTPQKGGSRKVINLLSQIIQDLIAEQNIRKKDIQGVGIGIPGLVNTQKGRIIATPNMKLAGVNIVGIIEKRMKLAVKAGNDVNLGILGEKTFGAVRGAQNVVGLFVGTGIGGGVIIDGKLVTGFQGMAGEIGHMIMDPKGPLCHCGNRGCLEAMAGRWAIERDIRVAVKEREKTALVKWADGDLRVIKSKLLKRGLKKGDALTVRVMRRASRALGWACVSLRHIFDPEAIVLGGGVVEACGDFMLPIIRKVASEDPLFSKLKSCAIVSSRLGDDAVLLGAAALFINEGTTYGMPAVGRR